MIILKPNGFIIGKRIDSALRGNIEAELRPLLKWAIVITDITCLSMVGLLRWLHYFKKLPRVSITEGLGPIELTVMRVRSYG